MSHYALAGVGRGSHRVWTTKLSKVAILQRNCILQGAEFENESKHKFKDPNSVDSEGVEKKEKIYGHEAGEVKVGKKWEFPVAQTKVSKG